MNEETNPQNIMLPTAVGGMGARNDPSGGEPVTGCGTPRRSTEQPAAFISPGYSQTTTTTQILHPTMFARAATRAWTAPASRAFSASAANFTKVAVLGAGGGIGQPLSLLLKSDPLVTSLNLYDIRGAPGVAADVSHVDTASEVCVMLVKSSEICSNRTM